MSKTVNVFTAFDPRMEESALVMLVSAFANLDPGFRLAVHYFHTHSVSLFEQHLGTTLESMRPGGWSVRRLSIPLERLQEMAALSKGPIVAYARLFIAENLPLSRIIYLDSDIVIERDLAELWCVDLSGVSVAAVTDAAIATIGDEFGFARKTWGFRRELGVDRLDYSQLGLSETLPYFNSGVMLIDLDDWRRIQLLERAVSLNSESPEYCPIWDQSLLNLILAGRWKQLDPSWNFQVRTHGEHEFENGTRRNIHFAAGPKPFEESFSVEPRRIREHGTAYFRYRRLTPCSRPKPSAVLFRIKILKARLAGHSTAMSERLVTFDIWDTCLIRATGSPNSIFTATARAVLPGATESEVAALAKQRDMAEDKARAAVEHRECTLSEIGAELARVVGAKLASDFIAAELRVERASVRPVSATRALVERSRASGSVVAFISDMYLPEAFLRDLLATHGFAQPSDPVFVSCEHRANKYTGGLYEIVHRTLPTGGHTWIHHGDNKHADILVARRHGAKVVEVRAADWTPAEKRALSAARRYSERIAGAMRAVRLATDPGIPTDRAAFLAGVAAPWLCALTARILRLAREDGRRRIHFLSRDGEILLRIARILAPAGIECRYLLSSRKAWCFPAMTDLSETCTSWLKLAPMRPDTLLTSLGFDPEERDSIAAKCGITPADRKRRWAQSELEAIWRHLGESRIEDEVIRRAAEARACCVDYLRSEGLFDDVPWAVADVGWSLHSQAALNRMLRCANAPAEAHGIYFMTRADRRHPIETGPVKAWLVHETGDSLGELLGSMSPVIEECLLTSPDPGVTGYRYENGKPIVVHSDSPPSPATSGHARELRTFAEAFAREIAPLAGDPLFVESLETAALDGLAYFFRQPTESEAAVLLGLDHATAPGAPTDDSQPLVRPYSMGDAMRILLRRAGLRKAGPGREPYWHAGSMAASTATARAGMRVALAPNPFKLSKGDSRT